MRTAARIIGLGLGLAACGDPGDRPLDAPVVSSPDGDLVGHDAAPRDATLPPASRWVLGYYVGYQIDALPIAAIDWSSLTDIAFAPMVVTADLSLDLTFDDSHGAGVADAQALATAAHAHGVHALLLLGGANAGANIATAAAPANRAAFVTELLGALDQLGYDGIDLDWEDSVDLDELVALAQDLRAARPTMELTYPAYPINSNFQVVDPRMVDLAFALDQFNVQTYFPAVAETGDGWSSWFVSPLSGSTATTPVAIDDTLARYAAAGIPKAKLGMGTAFYAICYTGGITGPRQPTTTANKITGGDNEFPLSAFYAPGGALATHPAASQRDGTTREPFLELTAPITEAHCGPDPTSYISYEDETSLADKGAFAKANGYGGIIVWTLAEGTLGATATGGRTPNALIHALHAAFAE